jgi:RES domain-containing protein
MRPTVIACASVSLGHVLELQDDLLDSAIGFSLSDLIAEDWEAIQAVGEESWSQAVGRGCKLAGFEAMIVPSARHLGGKNIVVFPENLRKSSTIEIEHQDLLPD